MRLVQTVIPQSGSVRAVLALREGARLRAPQTDGPDGVGLPAAASGANAALLVLEDAHWSDEGSLDLIDHLARTCQDAALMIACLARPTLYERRQVWGEGLPAHKRLNLEPLSRREGRALVESILRKAPAIPLTCAN